MSILQKPVIALLALATLSLVPADARAQDDEGDLEVTIRLMGEAEAELPEAVTREIELPAGLAEDAAAVDAAAPGLERANEARRQGREGPEQGQGIADDARDNAAADARENAADMAEAARENAENRSRAEEFRPEPPGPPDDPAPPDDTGPPNGQ